MQGDGKRQCPLKFVMLYALVSILRQGVAKRGWLTGSEDVENDIDLDSSIAGQNVEQIIVVHSGYRRVLVQ